MMNFNFKENSPREFIEKQEIKTYQTSIHKKVTISQVLSFFQEIAGGHTAACGLDWQDMANMSLFWALSRMKIEVLELPAMHDRVNIKTWSTGYKGPFAYREFLITNDVGAELVKASSMWIIVNLETRRPCRIEDYMSDFPKQAIKLFNVDPKKVGKLKNPDYTIPTKVGYSELDINQHLNNTSYLNRILNNFDTEFHGKHRVKNIELNFIKEARDKDLLAVGKEAVDEHTYLSSVVNQEGNDMVRALIEWKDIQTA